MAVLPWLMIAGNLLALAGCWRSGDPFLMTVGVVIFGVLVAASAWAAWQGL